MIMDLRIFHLKNGEILIGHKRLSILDLSNGGHQPMISRCKNYIISFNGEIYNYIELKKELEDKGFKFKSSGDTEVLLNAWIIWGKDAIPKLKGMFAFALLDKKSNTITLVRDGFGMKPLYFQKNENDLLFASEINALLNFPQISKKVNHFIAYQYLVQNTYDFSNKTFFDGIIQLKPGHLIEFNLEKGLPFQEYKWWEPNLNK